MQFRVSRPLSILATTLVVTSLPYLVTSEPVQYCQHGSARSDIDFCMGVLTQQNISTSSHDFYLTLNITRYSKASLGWSVLGLGDVMDGGLMFVVYGNPDSTGQPVVSVRTSTGHSPPKVATSADKNGVDVRVISAEWARLHAFPDSAMAMISLICYSCTSWPGSRALMTSNPQPWMWAFNYQQEMSTFELNANLNMHGEGGWGHFDINMPHTVGRPDNALTTTIVSAEPAWGVSENDRSSATNTTLSACRKYLLLHLHGIVMGAAFLLIFPTGTLAIRSGFPLAFKYHWVIQVVASGLTGVGFVLGLLHRREVNTIHQLVGIFLMACLGMQSFVGWRHHIVFLRLHRRTWLSHSHMWIGRLMMIGGWSNLITGIMLSGYSRLVITTAGVLIGAEILGFIVLLWWTRVKGLDGELAIKWNSAGHEDNDAEYFALGEDDKEEDTAVQLGREKTRSIMGNVEEA
jgi:hypothetical protein